MYKRENIHFAIILCIQTAHLFEIKTAISEIPVMTFIIYLFIYKITTDFWSGRIGSVVYHRIYEIHRKLNLISYSILLLPTVQLNTLICIFLIPYYIHRTCNYNMNYKEIFCIGKLFSTLTYVMDSWSKFDDWLSYYYLILLVFSIVIYTSPFFLTKNETRMLYSNRL